MILFHLAQWTIVGWSPQALGRGSADSRSSTGSTTGVVVEGKPHAAVKKHSRTRNPSNLVMVSLKERRASENLVVNLEEVGPAAVDLAFRDRVAPLDGADGCRPASVHPHGPWEMIPTSSNKANPP